MRRNWHDEEARDRAARDRSAYLGGLAWLGVLLVGLALAGGLVYAVYRAFAGFFGQYNGPEV
jgi:hypothetical protein